jgi:hypothetical protein
VAGFASNPAPVISGFSSISAENFRFQGNGVNILSAIGAYQTFANANAATQATSINTINNTLTSSNVAIGLNTGSNAQSSSATAVGAFAGFDTQGVYTVAIGRSAGYTNQKQYAVAIGADAGSEFQGAQAVSIGADAGYATQGAQAVAIGLQAGQVSQGTKTVAIGSGAGQNTQGVSAVAIGFGAGQANQGNNSIILNATGSALQQTRASTFTVAPVRNDVSNVAQVMFYNTTSKEVTYGNTISVAGNINASQFNFANGVNILSTVSAGSYGNTEVAAYLPTNPTVTALQANIGSFYTYANLNYGTSSYANANVIANLQNFVTSISTSANITTTANVIAPRYLFANGVNILSTITAVANLSNLTGNISWTAVDATPPTFTTASNGTKIVLWPSISSTMVDYAIGIEAGNTWFSIPQAANNFGYKWYAGNTAIATLLGNGTLTTGNITTTGNVSATNFVGNGAGLTNVTVSAAGNIVGTSSNVTLVAGNYSYTFDNTGNVTLPANVFVGVTNTFLPNTVASFSANVNYYSQVTLQNKNSGNDATADYIVTANNGSDTVNFLDLGIINSGYDNTTPSNSLGNIVFAADSYIYAQGNTSNANQSGGNLAIGTTTTGKTIKFFTGGTTSSAIAMTVANTGVTVGGNITATGTLSGSGSGLTGVALKTTGSWTVTTGTGTYSFTVPSSGTYQLWVDCNIPNGILVWNATATVTNTNVPVVGAQYAWVYNGGGTPIDFTSIPNQFVGTANTIVRSSVSPSATTNRFDFGLNNTSGGNVTVRYGWIAIS